MQWETTTHSSRSKIRRSRKHNNATRERPRELFSTSSNQNSTQTAIGKHPNHCSEQPSHTITATQHGEGRNSRTSVEFLRDSAWNDKRGAGGGLQMIMKSFAAKEREATYQRHAAAGRRHTEKREERDGGAGGWPGTRPWARAGPSPSPRLEAPRYRTFDSPLAARFIFSLISIERRLRVTMRPFAVPSEQPRVWSFGHAHRIPRCELFSSAENCKMLGHVCKALFGARRYIDLLTHGRECKWRGVRDSQKPSHCSWFFFLILKFSNSQIGYQLEFIWRVPVKIK